jgi:peptidoglycan/xylan/chitin deacetylase (PgdA/CDA1 family)
MKDQQREKNWNKNPFLLRIFGNYFVKTPWWLKKFYPHRLWDVATKEKAIYLSFDDGPHPVATPFVLDELKKINAKATFFCIGKNVVAYPSIYQRIINEGHRVGNHTYDHFNGWKTKNAIYLDNIAQAAKHIDSNLFRPPYGRIRISQAKKLNQAMGNRSAKVIMWSILSGDFDESLTREKCLSNVTTGATAGSIVVFHDSEKAFSRLEYALPKTLEFFREKGYAFKKIDIEH